MTAINSYIEAGAVVVLADTLMTDANGWPAAFVSKVFPVPHLSALVSGRGTITLIAGWAFELCHTTVAYDFDMAVEQAPAALNARWAALEGQRTETTTVYMWGWSAAAERFVGYSFRSWAGFVAEPLGDGTNYAPGLNDAARKEEIHSDPDRINAMARMMVAAKEENDALPADAADRCNIGGEIVMFSLTRTESEVMTFSQVLHRFPDRDTQYLQAIQLLNGDVA